MLATYKNTDAKASVLVSHSTDLFSGYFRLGFLAQTDIELF